LENFYSFFPNLGRNLSKVWKLCGLRVFVVRHFFQGLELFLMVFPMFGKPRAARRFSCKFVFFVVKVFGANISLSELSGLRRVCEERYQILKRKVLKRFWPMIRK